MILKALKDAINQGPANPTEAVPVGDVVIISKADAEQIESDVAAIEAENVNLQNALTAAQAHALTLEEHLAAKNAEASKSKEHTLKLEEENAALRADAEQAAGDEASVV
jgi:hypothetical protein